VKKFCLAFKTFKVYKKLALILLSGKQANHKATGDVGQES
jgi:hypothetical protein